MPASNDRLVKINYIGLLTYIRKIDRLKVALEGELDTSAAIRGMASEWQRNYDTEGSLVRPKWKHLSKTTRRLRKKRGYPVSHPILVQSGGLRRAAIEHPLSFTKKSMMRTVPGDAQPGAGGNTSIRITRSPNRAKMVLTGDKVNNNEGGSFFGHPKRLPKRKFWYVDRRVERAGAEELAKAMLSLFKEFKS